jgi:hypothetical protein
MLTNFVPCDYVLYLCPFSPDVAFLFSDMYFQNAYSFAYFPKSILFCFIFEQDSLLFLSPDLSLVVSNLRNYLINICYILLVVKVL